MYFYRVGNKNPQKVAAHIWLGNDTACRMWSTGGLSPNKTWEKSENTGGRRVCQMCAVRSKRSD